MKGGFEGNPPSSRKESYFLSNEKKKDYIARKLTCPKIALHSNNYKKCTSYD